MDPITLGLAGTAGASLLGVGAPTVLPGLAAAGAAGGGSAGLFTAISGILAGFGALQQNLTTSAIAEANAKQANANADYASQVGQQQSQDASMENRFRLGQQLAGQGASGLTVNSPSSVRGRIHTRKMGIADQFRIIDASNRQSANYKTDANMFRAESSAAKGAAITGFAGDAFGAYGSYIGDSKPTRRSPSYIPVPRSRGRLAS